MDMAMQLAELQAQVEGLNAIGVFQCFALVIIAIAVLALAFRHL